MAGFSSHDGKLHGNRQMVERYDESHGRKSRHLGKLERPHEEGGESGGEHDPEGHDEIKAVVEEHGPAKSHLITKTDEGYHSKTVHEDGHVHHHDHPTMEHAHEHGAHAFDDADHLGDMPRDDEHTAMEEDHLEAHPGRRTSNIGFME